MRVSVEVDPELLKEVMRLFPDSSPEDVAEEALRSRIDDHERRRASLQHEASALRLEPSEQ